MTVSISTGIIIVPDEMYFRENKYNVFASMTEATEAISSKTNMFASITEGYNCRGLVGTRYRRYRVGACNPKRRLPYNIIRVPVPRPLTSYAIRIPGTYTQTGSESSSTIVCTYHTHTRKLSRLTQTRQHRFRVTGCHQYRRLSLTKRPLSKVIPAWF